MSMKKILKILGIVFGAILLFVGAIFWVTQPVVQSADNFFALVKQNRFEDAYQSTAADFQKSTSFDQFQEFLKGTGLVKFQSSFWNSRSIENSLGKVSGTITTSDQQTVRLEIQFVQENGQWRVLNMAPLLAGISS